MMKPGLKAKAVSLAALLGALPGLFDAVASVMLSGAQRR